MSLSNLIGIRLILLILVIILPLVFFATGISPYESPKYYILICSISILFSTLLVFHIFKKRLSQFFHIEYISFLVMCFIIIQLIANFTGLDPHYSIIGSEIRHQGFVTLFLMFMLFTSIKILNKDKSDFIFKTVEKYFLISNLLVVLYATFQIILFYILSIPIPLYDGRIVGTLGNPSFLGGFIAMTIPFILLWKPKQLIWTILKIGLIILNIVVLISTESRAAFLATGIIFVYLLLRYFRVKKIWGHVITMCLIVLAFGAIIINSTNYDKSYINTIDGTKTIQNTLWRNSYWNNRWIIWHNALISIGKRSVLGYGQENFSLIFPSKQQLSLDHTHNIFLEIAISSGIIGLFLFILILLYTFKHSVYVIQLSLISFLIVAQFNPVSLVHLTFFWILIGLCSEKYTKT